MAILVITLLLLSTAFLHEAIDSVGTVPDLDLLSTIGEVKRPSTGSKGDPSANINGGFSQECEVEGFFNETEGEALMSVGGPTGTSYLRATVFENYKSGVWTPHTSVKKPYPGEIMPSEVSIYEEEIDMNIIIKPIVNMSGYIPVVLNLQRVTSEVHLEYVRDLKIFYSETPFTSQYIVSYSVYTYGEEMLESARIVYEPSYLEIPKGIADLLRQIAEEAVGNATTPYGKIMNIIAYLKENYRYNLKYPQAPTSVDPIEWFLTGSKEGVCTHFNSALVLLTRSLGIRARLAGGYLIQPELEAQLVYADQRHAFSEISFEGLGWVIFDATPSTGCSECESIGGKEEKPGEEGEADTCSPTDSVYNQSDCKDCVNNGTRLSPEGGTTPDIDLFEIRGITGSSYLRTIVGEHYDGLWDMIQPIPQHYGGWMISNQVSGYIRAPIYTYTISPLRKMGGFIPTARYTNRLWFDATVDYYPEQLIFFSSEVSEAPYSLSNTRYEFDHGVLNGAIPNLDSRYMNVPTDLLYELRRLASDATSSAETPYDKLNALESFLQSNYEYDVNYTRAPEGFDPVEWFLFHEKRGVCANFNSAFVLLARSIGLPARYIGGYLIDPSAEIQTVTSMQAHGYSEVPFEELGWVTFDATGPGPIQEEDVEEATIIGTSTEITWLDAIGVRGSTFNVVGRVLDEDGEAVDGLRTLVYLKEDKSEEGLLCGEGLVVDGLFNVTCSLPLNITIGYYQIDAHTLGNNRYNGSWSDPPLKVVSRTDFVLEAPEKVIAGKPFIFQGNLTEHGTGDPVSDTICTAEIRLEEIQLETDRNGYFEGTYTLTEPGNYTLSLEWPGSEYHLGSAAYSSVRIVPLTVTPGENEMMVRLEEAQIVGTVHAEELPGLGEEVVISIDGQDIGTAIADGDGGFTFTYEVPRTQELGEAQIGYRLVSASYSTTQQSAVYARTKVVLDAPSSIRVNRQFAVGVSLKDDLGGPMAEAELTLVEEGSEEEAIGETDSEGALEVALKIEKMPEAGFVSYAVRYGGEDYYLESSSEVTLDVLPPIGLPEMDVIKTVTNVLIFSVLVLIGYTVYVIAKRRLGKGEEDELGEAQLAPDEPEPAGLKQVVGILRQDDRFHFEFPQFSDPFPLVWGKGEELVFRMGLVAGRETFGGSVGVLLMVDEAEGPSFDLSTSSSVDHSLTFHEKGYHSIKVVFSAEGARVTACEALVKIVDYREEVNDLFNEEFEGYRNLREEIETHFTAREFMRSMLKGLSNRFYAPLNEMVSIFEIADYSLHDVRRSDYERFYAARQEFEEMKVGN